MSGQVLLYGANGVTGSEVAHYLAKKKVNKKKVNLKLAGRNAEAIEKIARQLDLACAVFDLSDAEAMGRHVRGAEVVLNAAGPFDETAGYLVRACIQHKTHYVDIGGEWPVFSQLKRHDEDARKARIMVLPGIGLTVAASDCLLKRAADKWDDTDRLCLGISRAEVISRGSVATAARLLDADAMISRESAMICRKTQIERIPAGSLKRSFDFGHGLRECVAMSWADIVTAPFSTKVPNVEVYTEMHWHERMAYRVAGLGIRVTGAPQARQFADQLSAAWPRSPSAKARENARFVMVVEALDKWRRVRRMKLHTLDGYTSSVLCAYEAINRILEGKIFEGKEAKIGFQTPSSAFGCNFIVDAKAGVFDPETAATAS